MDSKSALKMQLGRRELKLSLPKCVCLYVLFLVYSIVMTGDLNPIGNTLDLWACFKQKWEETNFSHCGQCCKTLLACYFWWAIDSGCCKDSGSKAPLSKKSLWVPDSPFPSPSLVSLAGSLRLSVSLLAVWQQCDTVKIITNKSW